MGLIAIVGKIGVVYMSFGREVGASGTPHLVRQLAARVFERRSTAVLVDLYCMV